MEIVEAFLRKIKGSLQIRTYAEVSVSFRNWKNHSESIGMKQLWWLIFRFAVQTPDWSQSNYRRQNDFVDAATFFHVFLIQPSWPSLLQRNYTRIPQIFIFQK